MDKPRRLMVFGAHNDDPEFDAGGLAEYLRRLGWEIRFVVVCHKRRCSKKQEKTYVGETYGNSEIMAEYLRQDREAAAVLGADKYYVVPPDNNFFFYREEDIAAMREMIEDFEPDIVLVHWPQDNHYEHVEAGKAAMLALSYSAVNCEVYAFEGGPWQTGCYFMPDFTVNITSTMEAVEKSLMCYDQISANGPGLVNEKQVIARYRGHMAGFEYGESYKILRFPCGDDPEMILPKLLGKDFRWGGGRQYMWGNQYQF